MFKQMKRHWLSLLGALLMFCCASYALAGELNSKSVTLSYDLKPKSETLAYVLAFDPLPADALFYSGKWVQGIVNGTLGVVGGASFWLGVVLATWNESGDMNEVPALVMGLGAALYFPMLIWDGVVGVREVKKHNAMVARQKKAAWWNKVQPRFAMTDDGYAAGATFNF